jgi:hypothetical protein
MNLEKSNNDIQDLYDEIGDQIPNNLPAGQAVLE